VRRPALTAWFARLGFAWARNRLAAETRRELAAHLDLLTERYIRAGMTAEEARAAAHRRMGNVTIVAEDVDAMNGIAPLDGVIQDLRYAGRQIRRSPGFSAVVIATLALGIGGTTAVFSVVHGVLLAPLPYREPGQLVRLYQIEPGKPDTRNVLTATHFGFVRDHAASFEDMAAIYLYSETGADLAGHGRARRLRTLRVTSGYFATLGARLLNGPGFDRSDEDGTRRVVLSDAAWRNDFNADPSIVGRTIHLSGEPYDVAGVAPPGLTDPIGGNVDAWVPYGLARDTQPENNSLSAIARLRAGVDVAQARSELAALGGAMKDRWPGTRWSAMTVVPLQEDIVVRAKSPLHLLLIAVVLLLLIASVNVANLVLVRAAGRVHEFALRSALGSGRGRLVRQLLVESLVLAGLGGALGVLLAATGVKALRRLGQEALPRFDEIGFDPTVLGFAVLTTAATAIACGIVPALRVARTAPVDALRQQSRSTTGSRGQAWVRNGLATAQLALALTLLAGAGVLIASAYRLQRVNLGFDVERRLTLELNLPAVRYDAVRRAAFQEELSRTLRSIPGVRAAGGISRLPATGGYHPWTTRILTGPLAGRSLSQARGFTIQQRTISGDLFAALDIPLLAGRLFDDRDHAGAPGRAIVSASFARHAFPDLPLEAALGQRIGVLRHEREIVGVVGDVAVDAYGVPALTVYHAHRQFADNRNWALAQVIATRTPPQRAIEPVRAAIAALDPELALHRVAPLDEVVGRATSRERFALVLMAAFAAVSLLLAALGLYGILAYGVRQRTREIGIRMTLGATAAEIRTMVLRQAVPIVGVGLIAGAAGAFALSGWLSALVFQISPSDLRVFAATALLLTATGIAASWLPARRASRIEPTAAMQQP
jgi:putative ABC transport system permease protein